MPRTCRVEEDAPAQEVSASELIQRQQAILAMNGENQRKREQAERLEQAAQRKAEEVARLRSTIGRGDKRASVDESRYVQLASKSG